MWPFLFCCNRNSFVPHHDQKSTATLFKLYAHWTKRIPLNISIHQQQSEKKGVKGVGASGMFIYYVFNGMACDYIWLQFIWHLLMQTVQFEQIHYTVCAQLESAVVSTKISNPHCDWAHILSVHVYDVWILNK